MYSRLHRTPPRRKSGTDQATGLTIELISKRLEVLREIAPHVSRVGFVSMEDGLSPALDKTNQLKFEAAAATAKALGMREMVELGAMSTPVRVAAHVPLYSVSRGQVWRPEGRAPHCMISEEPAISQRARRIVEGLVRTGRGSSPRLIDTYVKLNASSGGFYFIARDGEWLRRGNTFVECRGLAEQVR